MLNAFIERLKRTSVQDANEAAALLASTNLPDPDDLRRQADAFQAQLRADDDAWERLDRTSNPHAFAQQQAIAARRERLLLQVEASRTQVATAERQRAAFLALREAVRAMDQQIVQESQRLYGEFLLIASKEERRTRLEALDGLVRSRARVTAPLAVVSTAREFRRQPDPLGALATDLRERAAEIERALGPGTRRAFAGMPDGVQELIAALNEGRSA